MSGLRIRPAVERDAAAIQAIYAPYVVETAISFEDAPPSVEEMAERIARTSATHPYLVAEREGRVAGYAYATAVRARSAYRYSAEVTVYVAQRAQRRGVGRALYEALLETADHQGLHTLFACIALPNAASVALHEAVGFQPAGVWRDAGRKFDRWVDVGWWQRLARRG